MRYIEAVAAHVSEHSSMWHLSVVIHVISKLYNTYNRFKAHKSLVNLTQLKPQQMFWARSTRKERGMIFAVVQG